MKIEQDVSTRKMLLTMLKTSNALSVGVMAERLGITEMAVRRHLNMMERDGLVATKLVRQAMGRPTHLYSLTEHAEPLFPKNYHGLALDLLDELNSISDEDIISQLFERRKQKLIERYQVKLQSASLMEKVEALAEIQNDNGYMATWGQQGSDGSYTIDEFNCPISQIANSYNHACQSELELFQTLLGADVERIECLAKEGHKCRYMIRERTSKAAAE
jgi:predicted ArsR family transcriptional regulator